MSNLNKQQIFKKVEDAVKSIGEEEQTIYWWGYMINRCIPRTRKLNTRELTRVFSRIKFETRKHNNEVYYRWKSNI